MKNISKKVLLVNVFGTFGYFFSLLAWCWVALLYLPMLLENEYVEKFILPPPSQETVVQTPAPEMSLPMIILGVTVTIFIIIATIIVLLRAPVTIAKTGKTVTTKVAQSAIPIVTKGRPLPAAKKKLLTANLIKLAKLLLILLPVKIILVGAFIELPLPFNVAILVSALLALCALFWFSAQYLVARALSINPAQLV